MQTITSVKCTDAKLLWGFGSPSEFELSGLSGDNRSEKYYQNIPTFVTKISSYDSKHTHADLFNKTAILHSHFLAVIVTCSKNHTGSPCSRQD